jgi:hypothetical protein
MLRASRSMRVTVSMQSYAEALKVVSEGDPSGIKGRPAHQATGSRSSQAG